MVVTSRRVGQASVKSEALFYHPNFIRFKVPQTTVV